MNDNKSGLKTRTFCLWVAFTAILLIGLTACRSKNPAPESDASLPAQGGSVSTSSEVTPDSSAPDLDGPLPGSSSEPDSSNASSSPSASFGGGDAYFDRALFVGDSIMEGIRQYVAGERKQQTTLGEAKFISSITGITLADLTGDNDPCLYYSYKGEETPLEDIIADMDVDRVFLMLGLNDLSASGASVDAAISRYDRLIENLTRTFPDLEIIVITNPPKVASAWLPAYVTNKSFGNELIDEFVSALIRMCEEQGVPYVDAHQYLVNENGVLPDEYCRDGYIHLNNVGAKVVVDALYDFATSLE